VLAVFARVAKMVFLISQFSEILQWGTVSSCYLRLKMVALTQKCCAEDNPDGMRISRVWFF
jgi:hypothetical protein